MSDTKLFTTSALLEHVASNQDRNIIVIHDIVYDVTDFLDEHPGGEETLKEVKIKTSFSDATEAFEDTGHSMDARDMMKKYEIGQMDASVKAKTKSDSKAPESENKGYSLLTSWYIPAFAIIGLALAFHFFSNRS